MHYSAEFIEKHRDINVSHDWYDYIYESFTEDMEAIGVRVRKMYFSGFCSQGDGACFDGFVADWKSFLPECGYDDPVLLLHANGAFSSAVTQNGHYYNSGNIFMDTDFPLPEHNEDEEFIKQYTNYEMDDLRAAVVLAALSVYDAEILYTDVKATLQGQMDALYDMLETEYDYLTSDEAVIESLTCNGITEELELQPEV